MSFSRVHLAAPERPITIRGFACRYNERSLGALTYADNRQGFFAQGSHDAMLDSGANIVLQYGSHSVSRSTKLASTRGASLSLFASRFGLHFEATVWPSECPKVWDFIDKLEWIGCSVDGLDGHKIEEVTFEGRSVWKVREALCSHVALVPQGNFANARAWRADRTISNGIIQAFDAEWIIGQAESRRSQRTRPSKPSKPVTPEKRPSLRTGLIIPRLSGKNAPREAVAAYQDAFSRMRR